MLLLVVFFMSIELSVFLISGRQEALALGMRLQNYNDQIVYNLVPKKLIVNSPIATKLKYKIDKLENTN